jgi:predicted ATPase/class 3 adenylate cyclase
MRCSKCGFENPEGMKFCGQCTNPLALICPKCRFENPPGFKFCGQCTAPLSASAPSIRMGEAATDAEAVEGERKTVTALFADIKGSTELMRDLDPEEARAIVDPVLHLMMTAVHRYGGYVAQSTGDGIFALFGATVAHEDHPQRALHAALAMQEGLRRYAERLRNEGKIPVEARIGVNTGEVVVRTIETGGHTEYTPVGHVTNLAARMQALAPSGSIAVTDATRKLCEGYFTFKSLGPTRVKGVTEPVAVFEVTGLGPLRTRFEAAAQRGLTKFVGREAEFAQMKRALDLARSGHGQLIAVVAEAGAGKSRLVYEFKAILPPECKVLEAYSVSHGNASAWLPVLELLRGYFDIQDADDSATRREKVRATLSALDPALSETLPYLLGLLGIQDAPDPLAQMDLQIRRRRTLEALRRIILRESLKQPIVVVFEDLHWIDGETQALLDLLVDSIAGARILLLVNYRPEYRHEWSSKGYYLQLRLDPLAGENAAAMLAALLGEDLELEPLKRLIAERTGGNPLFIEEMVQALFDEGALMRNGAVKVVRPLSQLRLPPTVQGVLASRIDRLSAAQKGLLQTLAVIGRETPFGLIEQVVGKERAILERTLAELCAAEFIYEQPALTEAEYVFKHALTQEVAYNSLLVERRKLFHERAGQALESMFAEQLDDHLDDLAYHYSRSDNLAKAVEYLGRAGQQALQRSAHADAISRISAGLNLLQRLPDSPERIQRELFLQVALGSALIANRGFAASEVERAYARARELCERVGDPPELFLTLLSLCAVQLARGKVRTAHELAEQLLRRAQSAHDPAGLIHGHAALGSTSFWLGEFLRAKEHLETAITLYDPKRPLVGFRYGGADNWVVCLFYTALTLWHLGYPEQAVKRGNEAITLGQSLSHPFSLALAEFFVVVLRQLRREARAAEQTAESVIALSAERGFTQFLAYGSVLRGWAMAEQGRHEEGIAQIQQGLAASRASGAELLRSYHLCLLAEACIVMGSLDDGLSALTKALDAADEHEDRHHESEIYRLKGELLLKQNYSNAAEARSCFQRAIEIAREQSAKSWELRATMSLARLLAKQGHRDEARTMLAEIYNWFTEGLDTADVKDAKSLLDELSG